MAVGCIRPLEDAVALAGGAPRCSDAGGAVLKARMPELAARESQGPRSSATMAAAYGRICAAGRAGLWICREAPSRGFPVVEGRAEAARSPKGWCQARKITQLRREAGLQVKAGSPNMTHGPWKPLPVTAESCTVECLP